MSGRRSKADDEACARLHALALLAWGHLVSRGVRRAQSEPWRPWPEGADVGDFVVVIDGLRRGGPAANAVGVLLEHRPSSRRAMELWTIRTPRGVIMRWTNCVVLSVDRVQRGAEAC